MSPDFQPWRRNVDFLECTETPIRPLIEQLDFIEDKARWGYKFRFGVFKIDDHDLEVIRSAMTGVGRECGEPASPTSGTWISEQHRHRAGRSRLCGFAIRRGAASA